jgi:hypothetical protein
MMMDRFAFTALVFVALTAGGAFAQDVAAVTDGTATYAAELSVIERWQADKTTFFEASEIDLTALQYVARPLIVFADSPNQPQYQEQLRLLQRDLSGLAIRDVIVILDSDPAARTSVRQTLRPRGFSLVLMDKDGRVGFRKPDPWDVREIGRQIDKMPLRIQEVRDQPQRQ